MCKNVQKWPLMRERQIIATMSNYYILTSNPECSLEEVNL